MGAMNSQCGGNSFVQVLQLVCCTQLYRKDISSVACFDQKANIEHRRKVVYLFSKC